MKHLKALSLTAMTLAAMVLGGASTAAATELYQLNTVPKETTVKATLTGSAKSTSTSGTLLGTCTGGELSGKSSGGSSTTTIKIPIEILTWTGCIEPTETLVKGELQIHHISGTNNGTVTGSFTVWKENATIFGAPCEWTFGEALDLGTLLGSASGTGTATLAINVIVPAKNSFFCPDKKWEANYTFTSPAGLVIGAA